MIRYLIKLFILRRKWRKRNKDNFTVIQKGTLLDTFPLDKVSVGKMSYGPIEVHCFGADNEGLEIGSYVSIASGVKFILGGNHYFDTFSTYPFKVKCLGFPQEAWSKGPIKVEDDVWLGTDVIVLSGVTIRKGSVIGAGSVVAKDIPPYAIVVGNPARIVKYRFNESLRFRLLEFDYGRIDEEFIGNKSDQLYMELDDNILSLINSEAPIAKKAEY
jgi:acetyltransferase-like isoleucine patch superfamily enzyme